MNIRKAGNSFILHTFLLRSNHSYYHIAFFGLVALLARLRTFGGCRRGLTQLKLRRTKAQLQGMHHSHARHATSCAVPCRVGLPTMLRVSSPDLLDLGFASVGSTCVSRFPASNS